MRSLKLSSFLSEGYLFEVHVFLHLNSLPVALAEPSHSYLNLFKSFYIVGTLIYGTSLLFMKNYETLSVEIMK